MFRLLRSKAFTVVITAIVAGGAAGGGAYWWQRQVANDQLSVAQGNNDSLKGQLRQLQDANTQLSKPQPPPPPPPAPSDNDLVTAAVKADCGAQVGVDTSKGSFKVAKLTAPFARVTFSCAGGPGGAAAILKKVGDTWVIISKGQDKPTADTIKLYGIPADFQS